MMRKVLTGQILLILCCVFYLIWWYRGYRPGVTVERVRGINGFLLAVTAALGIAGLSLSLMHVPMTAAPKISPTVIAAIGLLSYFALLLVTRYVFHRIVTTELLLIVVWTMLEMTVISRLNAGGMLSDGCFSAMCAVIVGAFLISIVLYVCYYRMEAIRAFYAAMIPLITEAASMGILMGMLLKVYLSAHVRR